MKNYGVIDIRDNSLVGTYTGDFEKYSYPFDDTVNYKHFIIEDGKYAEGYYFENDSLKYDMAYIPPSQPYSVVTRTRLLDNDEKIKSLTLDFAVENSEIMTALNYTTEQKAAQVRIVVDAFKPISEELHMYSYYEVFNMLDNIVRSEPLLTDERINSYKISLAGILL